MKIKHILLMLLLYSVTLSAQNEWVLQPWMQVEGDTNGQRLGRSVGFAGMIEDSTKITVGDINGIQMFHIKTPDDTIPRLFFPGDNCSLGDFNGDSIMDLLVSGNPTKIYLGISLGVFDTIPFFVKYQEANGYYFGQHTAIGRINGDKFDDLLITDEGYPNGNLNGRVYLFTGYVSMDTIPERIFNGETRSSGLGWNVTAGDLNNNGFDDIIIRGYDQTDIGPNGTIRFAYLKIFLGGDQVDTIEWKYIKGTDDFGGLNSFDVNGDGVDDLLWSNIDLLSTVYIHYGKSNIDSIPNLKLNNPGIGGLGQLIINGGDLNGDGYYDIVCGAPSHAQDVGFVLVYSGGPMIDENFDAAAGLSVQSLFGNSIVSAGDVNGDGLDDILVGAPRFKWDEYKGKWFILLGDTNIVVTSNMEDNLLQPSNFNLFQNYPNPFNPTTIISWQSSVIGYTSLKIFDILGREIRMIVNEERPAGKHEVEFDGSNLSSGVYYYKLTLTDLKGNKQTQTKQMVLIK